ncbi:hypothetical protein LPC08_16970 [Roseomonas sp. OT10]|uniref:hypothetical protein n=1 Tax=Roseomonas cutis TaxID=2897332 RepID=UPI001E587E97|nr:hypothetical protein [Roseomonas sp. OT10]UFN47697.1 hypothetical protein LPC08_16970 [Roseomonas sp. OT10]
MEERLAHHGVVRSADGRQHRFDVVERVNHGVMVHGRTEVTRSARRWSRRSP